jgi:hypothetical protein
MAMTFTNLDPIIRQLMVEELNLDISLNKLYQCKRLTSFGLQDWPGALKASFETSNEVWLTGWLSEPGRLETSESYTVKEVTRLRQVPITAAQTFAEGEFNRFYIGAVCRQAIRLKSGVVTAYRARFSANPRSESVAIDGTEFSAESVLTDFRENTSVDGISTALGLPAGPNSGMSVRL